MQTGMIIASVVIIAVGFLPQLPSPVLLSLALLLALVVIFLRRYLLVIPFSFGLLWASIYGYVGLSQQLPHELQGVDLWVEGTVMGLPEVGSRSQRFQLRVHRVESDGGGFQPLAIKRLRLSWYQTEKLVNPGDRWRLLVRLKRPHGFANPGGFDYQGWLFRQGIGATGYVRKHGDNRPLAPLGVSGLLDSWRFKLLKGLRNTLAEDSQKGFLLALLMGERTDIGDKQWMLLSATGTNHLFVISGLHVGFVALCGYFLFFQLSRWLLLGPPKIAAQQVGTIGALLLSTGYAAIAGFSLPTQRALIMLTVILVGRLWRRQVSTWHCFALALLLVLLWDPLASHSAGFWLSFGAVGSLLYAFSYRSDSKGVWWRWGRPQWVVFIAFIPVLLYFFQQASLVSPVANVLANPFVGFIVVPLCLLAVVVQIAGDLIGVAAFHQVTETLLQVASLCLQQVMGYLNWLAEMSWAKWSQSITLWSLLPALAGVALLLAPQGLPARWVGILCLVPLFSGDAVTSEKGGFDVTVMDVGQGLAVLVRTEKHQLLYDTGARFSETFDAASAVLLPYFRTIGVEHLDKLVISHGDNDHAGALGTLLDGIEVGEMVSGASHERLGGFEVTACEDGRRWSWEGVYFVLMQASPDTWRNENERSCVLKIYNQQSSVLLTGDIESAGEASLIQQYAAELKASVLLAPHHGSLTSSSDHFLNVVAPETVIFSSGYRNRFGHPHSKIMARYQERNIGILKTFETGAIRMSSDPEEASLSIEKYRESFRRYWF